MLVYAGLATQNSFKANKPRPADHLRLLFRGFNGGFEPNAPSDTREYIHTWRCRLMSECLRVTFNSRRLNEKVKMHRICARNSGIANIISSVKKHIEVIGKTHHDKNKSVSEVAGLLIWFRHTRTSHLLKAVPQIINRVTVTFTNTEEEFSSKACVCV